MARRSTDERLALAAWLARNVTRLVQARPGAIETWARHRHLLWTAAAKLMHLEGGKKGWTPMVKKTSPAAESALRQMRQLAFEGWLAADDPAEVTTDDEYTPPELVGMVEDFLGGEIGLDPCWDPRCFVKPRVGYTKAIDGLSQNWVVDKSGKLFKSRWIQPPYSSPKQWLERLAELHDGSDYDVVGDSLALIKCDPSTRAWEHAWKADAILFFKKRIPHVKPGRVTRDVAMFPQALLYFGPHVDGFEGFFGELGVVRRKPALEVDAPVRRDHELTKIDGIPVATYPFLPTACEKHNAPECSICADAITVVDEPVVELDARAENPQAWPIVSPLSCKGCGAHFKSKTAQAQHRCLAGGSNR